MGRMLGKGAYAIVREAVHLASGFTVAIKIYDKYKLSQMSQIKKSVVREISILTIMSEGSGHPCIMKLFDAINTQRQLFLVIENCKG